MKHLSTALALVISTSATAQCTFTPTITPDPAITCPVGFLLLQTQAYDSYQWFESGQPITGQTFQVLQVDNASVGNSFTVQCTLNGCTEMSAPVVLDGWVFLLPFVITDGDPPHTIGGSGEAYYCAGDTAFLILGMPYDTGIQWTNNGTPLVGETNDTLVVTETGNYSVSGAPSICPGFIQQLGVTVTLVFDAPPVPGIVVVDDLLCITPTPDPGSFQWYLNGAPIVADACFAPTVNGTYTVTADYGSPCGSATSEPYDFFLGIADDNAGPSLLVRPNPANMEIMVASSTPLSGTWKLMDTAGREVDLGRFYGCTSCALDVSTMEAGNYLLTTMGRSVRIAVVR